MATAGVPLWSTTAASNSTADPAVNMAEGMAPSAVNDSVRALMASVAKWRNDLYGGTTGGTSTAFTLTTGSTFASASDMSGVIFTIIPNATSGATPTLAVDGLTARAINISTGVAIPTGALVSGTPYLVKYVHASTEFILLGSLGATLLTALDIINGTSLTAIATDDTLPLYDLSATANRRMLVSDFLKVVNVLTADASPDTAADYVMTYDASASAAKKVLLSNLPSRLARGYIDGCVISNGTDATNDINVAAGVCRNSTNAVDITVAAMSGKQLDANWAPGANAGMRNSAAGITNTTYHIYAVAKADGTQDIYAHTSLTVATVITALQAESGGSDYLYARRIASIVRTGATIRPFTQYNDEFWWSNPTLDVDNAASGASANTGTLSVPIGLKLPVYLHVQNDNIAVTYVSSLDQTDMAAITDAAPLGSLNSASGVINATARCVTNTSGQIRYRCSSNQGVRIVTVSYVDARGKDA